MSSLVTAPERSVVGKITRSGLDTRKSRPPASTITASDAAMPGVLRQRRSAQHLQPQLLTRQADRPVRTIILGSRRIDGRFRLIALVFLVIAGTAAGFVLTRVDSSRDAWLVFGTGLALAAVTGVLALTRRWHQHAMPEVERYFTLAPPRAEGGCTTSLANRGRGVLRCVGGTRER